jgi:hypothetical protein
LLKYLDQSDFDQGRQDREQRESDQRRDAARTALDVARQSSSLTGEMKAKRQLVQMAEGLQGDGPHRALGDLGKEEFAQFGECRRGQAQRPVGDEQPYRQRQHVTLRTWSEAVDDLLENDRNADVGDLGRDQAAECEGDAALVGQQVRQQGSNRLPITTRAARGTVRWGRRR